MFLGNNFCSAHLEVLQSPNQTRLVQHPERGILYNIQDRNEKDIHISKIQFIYNASDQQDSETLKYRLHIFLNIKCSLYATMHIL